MRVDNSNDDEQIMSTSKSRIKRLIAVLLESPFYLTLSLEERYGLLKGLIGRYPYIFK